MSNIGTNNKSNCIIEVILYLGGRQQLECVWNKVTASRAEHLKGQVDFQLAWALQIIHVATWAEDLLEPVCPVNRIFTFELLVEYQISRLTRRLGWGNRLRVEEVWLLGRHRLCLARTNVDARNGRWPLVPTQSKVATRYMVARKLIPG